LLLLYVFSDRDFNSSMYTAAFQQENQCRPEDITLREEMLPNASTVIGLDDFGRTPSDCVYIVCCVLSLYGISTRNYWYNWLGYQWLALVEHLFFMFS